MAKWLASPKLVKGPSRSGITWHHSINYVFIKTESPKAQLRAAISCLHCAMNRWNIIQRTTHLSSQPIPLAQTASKKVYVPASISPHITCHPHPQAPKQKCTRRFRAYFSVIPSQILCHVTVIKRPPGAISSLQASKAWLSQWPTVSRQRLTNCPKKIHHCSV